MRTAPHRRKKANAGFTLVELMVVISIIAILATIVGFNVIGSVDESNYTAAKAEIKNLGTALIAYKLKFKQFPDNLDQLINNEKNINFLTSKEIPNDPWGNPYIYTRKGTGYELISYGADGTSGGSDEYSQDITSEDL